VTRLLVWRHGQTEWNAIGRIQGHTDIGLDEVGVAQAEAAAAVLAAEEPDLIVSSDLSRARQTAAALAAYTGLPVRTDARLRERGHGPWEGLTNAELRARWPDEFERWRAGLPVRVDGVEDLPDVSKRVGEALLAATERAPGGTIVVTTHGGAAKRGCGALLGWPDEAVATVQGLRNCHWTELHSTRHGWRLYGHNLGPGLP
jgi:glucosyl-3-phosphoglycerate phosphatase